MAYRPAPDARDAPPPAEEAAALLRDIAGRREFSLREPAAAPDLAAGLRRGRAQGPRAPAIPGLRFHGAQLFIQNLAAPDTPYTRLLLNWATGSGKTHGALAVADLFVREFRGRAHVPPASRPSVFVVAAPGIQQVFQETLMTSPEYGFVSTREAADRASLAAEALRAPPLDPVHARLRAVTGSFKRRLTDRARGGYFRFFGYREFANRLVQPTRRGEREGFDTQALYAVGGREGRARGGEAFAAAVADAVARGLVLVNTAALESLQGGLIIADEIQNVYNIQAKNVYGVALQYALDILAGDVAVPAAPSCDPGADCAPAPRAWAAPRALLMSATPMTGSASEVVDLLNLLVPGLRVGKGELFAGGRPSALRPGALDKIGRWFAGRVSFVGAPDDTPGAPGSAGGEFPRVVVEGTEIPGIDYLRFTECPLPPRQAAAVGAAAGHCGDPDRPALPPGSSLLLDVAYPAPPDPGQRRGKAAEAPPAEAPPADDGGEYRGDGDEERGDGDGDGFPKAPCRAPESSESILRSDEVAPRLRGAPAEWRERNGVELIPQPGAPPLVGGPILRLRDGKAKRGGALRLDDIAAKAARVVRDIVERIRAGPGKILVFHPWVRTSGIQLLQEALRANGVAGEEEVAGAGTLCAVCGVRRDEHGAAGDAAHRFAPARFVVAHYYTDRATMARSIARFNDDSNVDGRNFRVLLGSNIIAEGYTFTAVRLQCIAGLPADIPSLVQVRGRVARRGTHAALPPEDRTVAIRTYVGRGAGDVEVARYREKMQEYRVIQAIEREMRRWASDAGAPGRGQPAAPSIAGLPFEAAVVPKETSPDLGGTYAAYGHVEREVAHASAAITALFAWRPVWTREDLWRAVQGGVPVRGHHVAPVAEDTFLAALGAAVWSPKQYDLFSLQTGAPLGRCSTCPRDPVTGSGWTVVYAPPFFVRAVVDDNGLPGLDFESYLRNTAPTHVPHRVAVADYVLAARRGINLARAIGRVTRRARADPIAALVATRADVHFEVIRAAVAGAWIDAERGAVAASQSGVNPAEIYREATTPGTPLHGLFSEYDRFGVVLRGRDVDAARRAALPGRAAGLAGYVGLDACYLWDGEKWAAVPRNKFGHELRHDENAVAVGYTEVARAQAGGDPEFKIRPPLAALARQRERSRDARGLQRGAVCSTRPRKELAAIGTKIGAFENSRDPPGGSVDMCALILARLLDLEAESRAGRRKGVRWFYLFNDPLPSK